MVAENNKEFLNLLEHIIDKLKTNKEIDEYLITLARKLKSDFDNQFLQRHWCASFKIPDEDIKVIYRTLQIDEEHVKELILNYLLWPEGKRIFGKSHYNIFLLLLMAYAKMGNHKMAKLSLFFILARLYNSVKSRFFPVGCNPDIFRSMFHSEKIIDPETGKNLAIDNRSIISKYQNPLELLYKYFVETLYEKYVINGWLKHNYDGYYVSQLFKQAWARLYQIFKSYAQTGLATKYYRIKELGLYQKSIESKAKDEDNEEELTINIVQSQQAELFHLIQRVVNNIVLSHNIETPPEIKDYINKKTKVRREFIENLSKHLADIELKNILEDILIILLQRLELTHLNIKDFCSNNILDYVDKKIVSSKHNILVNEYKEKLKELTNILLQKMGYNKTLDSYSHAHRIAILRTVNYILVYLIKTIICKQYESE